MRKRILEELAALRQEVADLRREIAELRLLPKEIHHHQYYTQQRVPSVPCYSERPPIVRSSIQERKGIAI